MIRVVSKCFSASALSLRIMPLPSSVSASL
jgi:hypothetical protein